MRQNNLSLFDQTGAVFSSCEKYRYRLWRHWEKNGKPTLAWILLNCSTATASANDPTVERCERRARMMGFGGVEVVNIFAYRATDPLVMKAQEDPIGPDNDRAILEAIADCGMVICGWGTHGAHMNRGREVTSMLISKGVDLHCLTITEGGHPGHPLYVGYDVVPKPFPGYCR